MDAYLGHQAQQMNRAKTFAEIRRIEQRVTKMAQARGAAESSLAVRRSGRPPPTRCRAL